jgi:hypothetical protein
VPAPFVSLDFLLSMIVLKFWSIRDQIDPVFELEDRSVGKRSRVASMMGSLTLKWGSSTKWGGQKPGTFLCAGKKENAFKGEDRTGK